MKTSRTVLTVVAAVVVLASVSAVAAPDWADDLTAWVESIDQRVTALEAEVFASDPPSPTPSPSPSPSPSPTPSPSPSPTADPPTGFPDATTTGVTDESVLTPSGSVTTSHDGQVISDLIVDGAISVVHSNVTIRNVRVLGTGTYGISVPFSHHSSVTGLLIEDTEIIGVSGPRSAGLVHYGKWTARRVDVSGYNDGVKMGEGHVLEDSYIHGLYNTSTSHNDGIQVQSGGNSVIRGNNVVNDYTQTSAIMLQTNFGAIDNYLIENNRLYGGGYTMYIEDKGKGFGPPTNVTVRDNVWVSDSWQWGPLTVRNEHPSLVWEGNMFDDGTPFNR